MAKDPYHFVKVEDYFRDYQQWSKLSTVTRWKVDDECQSERHATISLVFQKENWKLLIQFLNQHSFCVRFNPHISIDGPKDYSPNNSRAVVLDTFTELKEFMEKGKFKIIEIKKDSEVNMITQYDNEKCIRLKIANHPAPFSMAVYLESSTEPTNPLHPIWEMANPSVYYKQTTNDGDYSIIQAVRHPPSAKYIGFGEQGGKSLLKHTCQLNYFNYDNMKYRQVYNKGPFEEREPLYHTDVSFLGFNPLCGYNRMYGLYVDNPSQICVDLAYSNSTTYMFGVRFGDLDYYISIGACAEEITKNYAKLIGTPRLKPRYALGYHQGCYGYENRDDLERVVKKYREFQIPLDGLHVDVDIQHNYQTFTIDESKFPNPKEMFQNLRNLGVKCSTNITPIISDPDENYKVYREGRDNGYSIKDIRSVNGDSRVNQWYEGGNEQIRDYASTEKNYNSGKPYIGEVYYGGGRGTTGHYPDLARKAVREWWGKQYQGLFDLGLEMVWQDMTTPAIRETKGDMKGFLFRLKVGDDYLSVNKSEGKEEIKTEAIKI